jgi:hypothetical protein
MQYLMLVRVDPDLPVPADADVEPWVEEGTRTGMRLEGNPAEDPSTATTVRVRDGETLVSDGPFAEVKEYVAGYDMLEADSLEQAVDYAAKHPVAKFGAIEVRQVWDGFVSDADDLPAPRESGVEYLFLHVPDPERIRGMRREDGDPTDWVRKIEQRRATLGGHRLRDEPDAGAVVRVRNGETLITRGPFAETAEQIAGIDLVRVDDLDEALELAATHPTSRIGAIEVRPLVMS